MIQSLLDRHVESDAIAGAVALAHAGHRDRAADAVEHDLPHHVDDQADHCRGRDDPGGRRADCARSKVARFLPDLADRRVLHTPQSARDDTLPAVRPIVVEDLLTLRLGIGWLHGGAIAREMQALGAAPDPTAVGFTPDDCMERIGRLPLAAHPGERWRYHTGADILSVLIARAAGMALPEFLHTRLFQPLGMPDTGFHVPAAKLDRLATGCRSSEDGLEVADPAEGGEYAAPPLFPSELVSTAGDYARCARMLLKGGEPVLTARSVQRMMQDHITPAQKAASPFFPGFWDRNGWSYGDAVVTRTDGAGPPVGSYGWTGGYGTNVTFHHKNKTNIPLLSQCLMTDADDVAIATELGRIVFPPANKEEDRP